MGKILFQIRTVKWYVFLTKMNSRKGNVLKNVYCSIIGVEFDEFHPVDS
jgi:hypothetical protein